MTLGSFVLCFFIEIWMLGVATSMTIAFPALQYFHSGGGGGGTPNNGLYGETPTAKGVPFQASGTCICKDFTSYSIRKCREICHFGL